MKKTFTILIAAIAAIMLITQPLKVVGQTRSDYTITLKSANNENAIAASPTVSDVLSSGADKVQSISTSTVYNGNNTSNGWRFGSGNNAGSATFTLNTTAQGYTVSKVTINAKVYSSDGSSLKVTVKSTAGTNVINGSTSTALTSSFVDYDFTIASPTTIQQIKIENTAKSKRFYVYSIKVTYSSGPTININNQTVTGNNKTDGLFAVTYDNITPTTGTIALYDNAAGTTPFSGDWLYDVSFENSKTTDFSKINYKTRENTTGSTRDVYMKISVSDASKGSAEKIVKVTQKRCYTVTFNGHGGETDTKATSYTQYISNGDATNLMANQFTKDNSIFTKWTTNEDGSGTEYEDEEEVTITADLTLYAQWETKHTITYYSNNGWGSEMESEYAKGTDVTIEENPFIAPSDTKVFKEWNTQDDGNGTGYNPGDVIEGINDDYELYAIWVDKCTVTLISNGMTTTADVPQGVSYTFPTPSNVPAGYAYRGFSTKSSDIIAGDVKTSFTPGESTATYYAVFSEGGFEKVTSAPTGTNTWDGDYLIVYEGNTCAFNGGLETLDAAKDTINVTISNSKIAYNSKTASAMFTIASNNSYYTIKSASGKYIGRTSSNNGMDVSAETSYLNSISYSNSAAVIRGRSNNSDTYYLRFNNGTNDMRFRYYSSSSQQAIQLYKLTLTGYTTTIASPTISGDIEITTPTTISSSQTFSGNLDITETLTIGGSAVVTVEGTISNDNPADLIIEDGGQLITSSSVQLTYKKGITSAAKAGGGWYTISTPVHTASNTFLEHESVENLILTPATNYDLFYYDEATHYWMNYKQAEFDLNVAQGYLYRNNGAELHFAGYNNQAAYYEKALSYASSEDKLLGFNLIGNPYPQNITMSDVTVNNSGTLSGGYVLSKDGAWSADVAATIAPAQGFLVQIDKADVTARITKPTGGSKSRANNDYIKFIVANSQHEDAAFALFEEGYGLNKIDHRNSDIPMLYIPKDEHNFAIATMADNTQSFNLNLKAKTTGKYTLTYKATGNYSYLHVIDRLTGEDVDMLLEGEYSFIASPSDNENRFVVRLEYSNGYENSEDSIFAYQSGSDIIVNGEGELQIFDVMGRRVSTQYVSGVETINLQSHGVYIFKLNEKTQKIVVR